MTDYNETENHASDVVNVEEFLFGGVTGEKADDAEGDFPVGGAAEEVAAGDGTDDAGDTETAQGPEAEADTDTPADEPDVADNDDDAGEQPAPGETEATDELKVVLSIRGNRATIGVQRPSADPHIESFDDPDLFGLADEFPAVVARARARWEEEPMHPGLRQARSPDPAAEPAPAGSVPGRNHRGGSGSGTAAATRDAAAVLGRAARGQHTGGGCRMAVSFPSRPYVRPFLRLRSARPGARAMCAALLRFNRRATRPSGLRARWHPARRGCARW